MAIKCDMTTLCTFIFRQMSSKQGRQPSQVTVTRLNQREIDNACHRLSRVPQKFAAPKQEATESYAISFFNNNPDVPIDKRAPSEKLEEIDAKLAGDL